MSFAEYKILYPKYFVDDSVYVYGSVGKYLIVYKKVWSTKTNEKRKNVYDKISAEHKANKLLVEFIIEKKNPQFSQKYILDNNFNEAIHYTVGEVVNPKKNQITFYNSYVVAYYVNLLDYYKNELSEPYITWYANGRKSSEGNLLNGEMNGKWIFWYNLSNPLAINKKSFVAEYNKGLLLSKIEY